MAYEWNWAVIGQYKWALLDGFLITIQLSLLSIILGTLLGLLIAILRRNEHPLIRLPTAFISEILRALPILVILIWLYYVLPVFGIIISGYAAALLGLTLSLGAFSAETIRSGIESIPKGQMDSAFSLGYTKYQALFKIILPQAYKRMLPNLIGLYIHQIKNTALASVIAVGELLHSANIIISATYRPLEMYTAIAVIYLIIILPIVAFSYYIERKLGVSTTQI